MRGLGRSVKFVLVVLGVRFLSYSLGFSEVRVPKRLYTCTFPVYIWPVTLRV